MIMITTSHKVIWIAKDNRKFPRRYCPSSTKDEDHFKVRFKLQISQQHDSHAPEREASHGLVVFLTVLNIFVKVIFTHILILDVWCFLSSWILHL